MLGIRGGASGKGFDLLGIQVSQADFCDCRVSCTEKVGMSPEVFLKGNVKHPDPEQHREAGHMATVV